MPKKNNDNKVFDVSKPGKTAASASSRPLIVGHKTLIQDPMVTTAPTVKKIKFDGNDEDTGNEASSGEPDSEVKLLATPATNIEPPKAEEEEPEQPPEPPEESEKTLETEEETPEKVGEPVPSGEPEASTEEETLSEESPNEEPAPETEEQQEETSEPSETSENSDDKSGEQSTKKSKKEVTEKEDKDAAIQGAAYQKLVDDKTYFVPIGEQKRERSLRLFLLVVILFLLLGIVTADVLIENGTIKTNIRPPINLIHNQ